MKTLALTALAAAIALVACTDKTSSDAVPRQTAYPRLQTYDTIYTPQQLGSFEIPLNAAAVIEKPQPGWLNATYPRYGITLYLSAIENLDPERYRSAIANRHQRLSLNLGDRKAVLNTFSTGSYQCMLVVCRDGSPTPVQFIAGNGKNLIAGSAAFAGKPFPVDSVSPVIDAISDEVIHMLLNLDNK